MAVLFVYIFIVFTFGIWFWPISFGNGHFCSVLSLPLSAPVVVFVEVCNLLYRRGTDERAYVDPRWSLHGLCLSYRWCVPCSEVVPTLISWDGYWPISFVYTVCKCCFCVSLCVFFYFGAALIVGSRITVTLCLLACRRCIASFLYYRSRDQRGLSV